MRIENYTPGQIRAYFHRLRRQCRPDRIDAILVLLIIGLVLMGLAWQHTLDWEREVRAIQTEALETTVIIDETIPPLVDLIPAETVYATEATEPVWQTYTVTAYCSCRQCCGKTNGITASGTRALEGRTIGADWSVLPAGTVIEIETVGIRTVEDRGGAIRGMKLDLFMDSHAACLVFGRQTLKVRVIE